MLRGEGSEGASEGEGGVGDARGVCARGHVEGDADVSNDIPGEGDGGDVDGDVNIQYGLVKTAESV